MSFEQEINIDIDINDKNYAQIWTKWICDSETKSRAFTNTLGADLGLKFLASNGIEVNRLHNMHTIRKILGELDIADVMLPNIHIDFRVVYNENYIFIPKSHFDYNIVPDIYVVLKLAQDKNSVSLIGFFEPKLLNTNNANDNYYFFEKEKLSSPADLISFIQNFNGNTNEFFDEENFENAENLIFEFTDENISTDDKKQLLKLLTKNDSLREKFMEFENFEILSHQAVKDIDVSSLHTKAEEPELETLEEVQDVSFEDFTEFNPDEPPVILPAVTNDPLDEALDTQKLLDNLYNYIDIDDEEPIEETPSEQDNYINDVSEISEFADSNELLDEFETEINEFDENSEISENEFLNETFDEPAEEFLEILEEPSDDNTAEDFTEIVEDNETPVEEFLTETFTENIEEEVNEYSPETDFEFNEDNENNFDEITEEEPRLETFDNFDDFNDVEETVETAEEDNNEEPVELSVLDEIEPAFEETPVNEENYETETVSFDDALPEMVEENFEQEEYKEEPVSLEETFEIKEAEFSETLSEPEPETVSFDDVPVSDETFEEFKQETIEEPELTVMEELAQTLNEDIDLSGLEKLDIEPLEITSLPEMSEPVASFDEINSSGNTDVDIETQNEFSEKMNEGFEFTPEMTDEMPEYSEEIQTPDEQTVQETDLNQFEIPDIADLPEVPEFQSEDISEVLTEIEGLLDDTAPVETFVENTSEEVEYLEPVVETETVPDEIRDEKLEVLYNEKENGIDGMQKLKALQEDDEKEPDASPFLKFARTPDKKNIIIGAAFVTLVSCLIIYATLFKSKTPDIPDEAILPENQSVQDIPLPTETPDISQNTPALQPISKEELQAAKKETQKLKTPPPKQQTAAGDYLSVSKISWEVPYYLSSSDGFRRYLQTAGKSIKLSLSSDLLLTSDYAYSNQVKVNLDLSKDGSVKNASLINSSGSDQIDNIVLQTVKDTLNVVKPPANEVQGTNFHLVVIINF